MTFNLILGMAAIVYGLWTAYARAKTPEKFAKLEAMKQRFGDRAGTTVHVVAYTLLPIALGFVLLGRALAALGSAR